MKETYESIDWSKVGGSIKAQFDSIKAETNNFSDSELMGVYEENFTELVKIVKTKHPEAVGGKAAPAKPETKPKGKKEKKPATKKSKKAKKRSKKAKSPKKKKAEVMFQGKPLSKADCDELIKQYRKRREDSKKSAQKSKTKSIFEKVTDKIEGVVEQAIESVSKDSVKKDPKEMAAKIFKLSDATNNFLKSFKEILGADYDSKEVQDVVKALDALAKNIVKKYEEK